MATEKRKHVYYHHNLPYTAEVESESTLGVDHMDTTMAQAGFYREKPEADAAGLTERDTEVWSGDKRRAARGKDA